MKKLILALIFATVIVLSIPSIILIGYGIFVGMHQAEKQRVAAPLIEERRQQILREQEFWGLPFSPFSQVKEYHENTWLVEYRDTPSPSTNRIRYSGITRTQNLLIRCDSTTFLDKPEEWLWVSYHFVIDDRIQSSPSDAQMDFIKSFLMDSLEWTIPNTNQRQQILEWMDQQLALPPIIPNNDENSILFVDDMKISMRRHSVVKRENYNSINSQYHLIVSLEIEHKDRTR